MSEQIDEFPSFITVTLEDRVKLAYAQGRSDLEIAEQESISIAEVENILKSYRLPIKITSIRESILRDGKWIDTGKE